MRYVLQNFVGYLDDKYSQRSFFSQLFSQLDGYELITNTTSVFKFRFGTDALKFEITYTFFNRNDGNNRRSYIDTKIVAYLYDTDHILQNTYTLTLPVQYTNSLYTIAFNDSVLCYNNHTFLFFSKTFNEASSSYIDNFNMYELIKNSYESYSINKLNTSGAVVGTSENTWFVEAQRRQDSIDFSTSFHNVYNLSYFDDTSEDEFDRLKIFEYGATFSPERLPFKDINNPENIYFNIMNLNGMSIMMSVTDIPFNVDDPPPM